jgi:DNA ligase-4
VWNNYRWEFAQAIAQQWEGFVLKGCDDPHILFHTSNRSIKLKKDYIAGLGDTVNLAIIGGYRDTKDEQALGIGKLWWTSFYVRCLNNKEDIRQFNTKPRLHIIDKVDWHGILKENI